MLQSVASEKLVIGGLNLGGIGRRRRWTSSADCGGLAGAPWRQFTAIGTADSVQNCSLRRDRDHASIRTPPETCEQYCSAHIGSELIMWVAEGGPREPGAM
jgi:hypothetical protein